MGFLTAGAHSLDAAHTAPDGGRPSSLPLTLFPSTARPIPAPLLCSPAGEAPPPAPTTYLLRCRTCSLSCAHLPCSTGQRALRRRVRGTATPAPSTFPMPGMAGLAAARRPWRRRSGADVRRQRGGVVEQALELQRLQDLLQRLEIPGGLHDAVLAEAALDLAVGAAGRRVVVLRGLQEHLVRVEAAAPLERARTPHPAPAASAPPRPVPTPPAPAAPSAAGAATPTTRRRPGRRTGIATGPAARARRPTAAAQPGSWRRSGRRPPPPGRAAARRGP
ncbi:hypothetical protein PVAP13_3NG178861 [Panicum virgatum]|uniref:Uncharacterized protein n=1 Tax=Panicum virgatum TaxID=38727 RepID=A0A8T0TZ31_PANVG|nr:hypothetical protein PVAP13_3NG178861 [Panicum virgatum]